jgi:hypothetical protein
MAKIETKSRDKSETTHLLREHAGVDVIGVAAKLHVKVA